MRILKSRGIRRGRAQFGNGASRGPLSPSTRLANTPSRRRFSGAPARSMSAAPIRGRSRSPAHRSQTSSGSGWQSACEPRLGHPSKGFEEAQGSHQLEQRRGAEVVEYIEDGAMPRVAQIERLAAILRQ